MLGFERNFNAISRRCGVLTVVLTSALKVEMAKRRVVDLSLQPLGIGSAPDDNQLCLRSSVRVIRHLSSSEPKSLRKRLQVLTTFSKVDD